MTFSEDIELQGSFSTSPYVRRRPEHFPCCCFSCLLGNSIECLRLDDNWQLIKATSSSFFSFLQRRPQGLESVHDLTMADHMQQRQHIASHRQWASKNNNKQQTFNSNFHSGKLSSLDTYLNTYLPVYWIEWARKYFARGGKTLYAARILSKAEIAGSCRFLSMPVDRRQ